MPRVLHVLLDAARDVSGQQHRARVVDLVGLAQPTVSRHLAVLKAAGLVTERKEGRWTHYRTVDDASGFRARLLSLLDTWGSGDDVITRDWRRAEELRRAPARA